MAALYEVFLGAATKRSGWGAVRFSYRDGYSQPPVVDTSPPNFPTICHSSSGGVPARLSLPAPRPTHPVPAPLQVGTGDIFRRLPLAPRIPMRLRCSLPIGPPGPELTEERVAVERCGGLAHRHTAGPPPGADIPTRRAPNLCNDVSYIRNLGGVQNYHCLMDHTSAGCLIGNATSMTTPAASYRPPRHPPADLLRLGAGCTAPASTWTDAPFLNQGPVFLLVR